MTRKSEQNDVFCLRVPKHEHLNMCCSPSTVSNYVNGEGISWIYSLHGKMRNVERFFVDKEQGNIPLGIPKLALEDRIKIELKYVSYEGVYWIYLSLDTYQWLILVNTTMKFRVHKDGSFLCHLSDY